VNHDEQDQTQHVNEEVAFDSLDFFFLHRNRVRRWFELI
jgi:hypothetical protein